MRPTDLAAIGIALATSLLVVQTTWTPPLIEPPEATAHIGERVRIQGMVVDLRLYDDAARFVLVGGGGAVHAWAPSTDWLEDSWVEAVGTIDRQGGRPLLRVESATDTTGIPKHADIVMVARDPAAHVDRLLTIQGHLERSVLEGKGVALRTTANGAGPATLEGVLRYEPDCLCYILHVDPAWTP